MTSLVRSSLARAVALVGLALVVAAAAANQAWLDRHFLPSFFVPRQWYVWLESAVRLLFAGAGVGLMIGRRHIARALTAAPALTLQVIAAAVLAVVAGAFVLGTVNVRPTEWLRPEEEPRRQEDAELGWVLAPDRTGHSRVGGRPIDYAIDAAGYRVARSDEPVDRQQITLMFAGESVMFGEGLRWDETIPAGVAAMLGTQSANLAVHGYSTDQMYLRLARELPRFRRPAGVVAIFMTELFGRNLDDDRPHLGPGLVRLPAQRQSRLMAMAGLLVPYRRDTTVERGVDVTREVLRAIVQLAREHGATPLVVMPQFGVEADAQRRLRERIVTPDVPSVFVPLDPDWRLPWDRHPNARAAKVIAAAIAARFQGE
jgi:hypothetical protein